MAVIAAITDPAYIVNAGALGGEVWTEDRRVWQRLSEVLPKGLTAVQLYDSGTTAVEAGIRVCRAVTGKSGHSASLALMNATNGAGRAQGFYMMPRPNPYRPLFKKADGSIDTDAYNAFFDEFVLEARSFGKKSSGGKIEPAQPCTGYPMACAAALASID